MLTCLHLGIIENLKMGHGPLRVKKIMLYTSQVAFSFLLHTHMGNHTPSCWTIAQAQKPFANFRCCSRPFPVWSLRGSQLRPSLEIPIVQRGHSTHAFKIQGHSYK